jgi:hypothetical protein
VTVGQAKRRGVPVTVVPGHEMDGRHIALLVLEQFYGITPDAAEIKLQEFDARGGQRQGEELINGVSEEKAKKPITVYVEPPRADPAAAEDVQLRAQDLAAMAPDDQKRINDEVDRRFWKKLGDESHRKLGLGRDEQAQRELWVQTRDEVMQQRDVLLTRPEALRDFLAPTGAEIAPENYEQALRIAEKAKDFSDADWARYERNVVGSTDDLSIAEDAISRFAAQRAKEQAIADRVRDTEGIFTDWHRERASVPYGWREERARFFLWANRGKFASMDDYDAACDAYLQVFRDRALEIAFLALRASESVVRAERARYTDAEGVKSAYADLAGMRDLVDKARIELDTANDLGDQEGNSQAETDRDQDEKIIMSNLRRDTEAERKRLAPRHAIFADKELATEDLTKRDPAALAKVLADDAQDRLHDIEKTRARLVNDPEAVFQLDNVLQAARNEMGADPDHIHGMIVTHHLTEIKQDHVLRTMALTVLAIGLGLLTFGTGAVAVLAGAALLAQGVYTGIEEVKAYGDAFSAAHTAFDSGQSLSSNSPSAFWAAFALISAGLDGAMLTATLRAASTPLHLLEETGSLRRFDAALAEATELSTGAKSVLARALKAKPELDASAHSLRLALKEAEGLGIGAQTPKVLGAVSKSGYAGAKLGLKSFDEFMAYAKASQLRRIEFDKLSADELAALKEAFDRGVRDAETAGVAIEPGEAAGGTGADPTAEPPKPQLPEPPKAKPPDAEPAEAGGAAKGAGKPLKAGDEREVAGGARVRYGAGGRRTLCINPCAELDHLGLSDDEIDGALRYLGTVPDVDTRDFVETLAAFKGADDIPTIQSMVRALSRSTDAASGAASAADLLDRITHLRQIEDYQFNLSELAAAHARGDAILAHGPIQTPEFLEDIQWGGRPVGEWRLDNGQLSFPNRRPLSQHRLPPQLESLDFVIVENESGSGLRLIMGRNHSGLSGGKAYVFAAGEFRFAGNGELVAITRLSGHYRPAVRNLERAREFLRQHHMLSPRGVELMEAVP